MQQHGTFGKMTKQTNCAKNLMIERGAAFSPLANSPPAINPAANDTHDTSQALTQVDFSEKRTCQVVLPRTKFKVHTGSNIRLASPQST